MLTYISQKDSLKHPTKYKMFPATIWFDVMNLFTSQIKRVLCQNHFTSCLYHRKILLLERQHYLLSTDTRYCFLVFVENLCIPSLLGSPFLACQFGQKHFHGITSSKQYGSFSLQLDCIKRASLWFLNYSNKARVNSFNY